MPPKKLEAEKIMTGCFWLLRIFDFWPIDTPDAQINKVLIFGAKHANLILIQLTIRRIYKGRLSLSGSVIVVS